MLAAGAVLSLICTCPSVVMFQMRFRYSFFFLQHAKNGRQHSNMSLLRKVKSLFPSKEKPALPAADSSMFRNMMMNGPSSGGPMIWPVHPDVQKEIQKGTQFNMKIVVRGMRRVGKSTIVSRLCGNPPSAIYIPSPEISAGTIFFRSRTENKEGGGAKVELWDVVDEGFKKDTQGGSTSSTQVADARSIDVYRGCHLVAFVIDRTRKETMEYAVREARHVPPTTAVLFVLNFQDSPEDSHVVLEHDVDAACRELRRTSTPMVLTASRGHPPPECCGISATWVSVSAVTGEGMDLLRNTLEIPCALIKATLLEAQIFSHFQFIKQHQAWLITERARPHLLEQEEREDSHPYSSCRAHQLLPQIPPKVATAKTLLTTNASGGADPTGDAKTSDGLKIGVTRGTTEEDANDIMSGFFDDIDETDTLDDDGCNSNDNHGDSPKCAEQASSLCRTRLGYESLGIPDRETLSSPKVSPLITKKEDEDLFRFENQNVHLDFDKDNELGDDFFGTGASVDSSLHDVGNDNDEVGTLATQPLHSEDVSSLLQGESRGGHRAEVRVESTSAAPLTSLQEDVSALLLQMQSALEGATFDLDERRHIRGNRKKHSRHERKQKERNKFSKEKRSINQGELDMLPVDDGRFEVINE